MPDHPPDLAAALDQALYARGPDYAPNTRHMTREGRPKHTNRLILESSPYLLQHAHNPVDWRPWGDDALEAAQARNCPIFLSVGYATCHWCHVMEEESFDDEGVAKVLNANFVAVKMDREARPDLDHAFMIATQAITGGGGWPNSLFLLPDGRPFHAGTYFPKSRFLQLLASLHASWQSPERRREIERQADQLAATISQLLAASAPASAVSESAPHQAAIHLRRSFNSFDGGFSRSTQFPQEAFVLFLLDYWRRHGDGGALAVAIATLHAMACGGIHDQIGGGFHRYTVDVNWRTPHFEKMLYNQALMLRAFVDAFMATGAPAFRRAALRIIAYLQRDLTVDAGPAAGAFYAAEDADSETPSGKREEGYFYVWKPEQIVKALGEEREWVVRALGIDLPPTVESGAVPHLDTVAGVDFEDLDPPLDQLLEAREARPRPRRDDKVLADWNGLAIRALAEAGLRLNEPSVVKAAEDAGEAVWSSLHAKGAGLHHFFAEGRREGIGLLTDHACLGLAFGALAEATLNPVWRQRAEQLAGEMRQFEDGTGRFRESADAGPLGPIYLSDDGATPSGESSTLEFLARLALLTGSAEHRGRAELLRNAIAASINRQPMQRTVALVASALLDDGSAESSRSFAQGSGCVVAEMRGAHLRMAIRLRPEWHVNANQIGDSDLVATEIRVTRGPPASAVIYPMPVERSLGFASNPLALYEGEFAIEMEWAEPPEGPVVAALTLQACSDSACLEPETLEFRLR